MNQQALKDIGDEFIQALRDHAIEAGQELAGDLSSVRDDLAARMAHLSRTVGEPGFRDALVAERDNLAMKTAGRAIDRGDAFDSRILGLAEGTLLVGSKLLAAIVPG